MAPVAGPWQVLPDCFEWNDYIITEVSEASELIEGAQIAGVPIRSMHDVLLVQSAKRARMFEHNFQRDSFRALALPEAYTCRHPSHLGSGAARQIRVGARAIRQSSLRDGAQRSARLQAWLA